MASVATDSMVAVRIDHYLTYLVRAVGELVEFHEMWDDLDYIEQEVFQLEWGIKEDRLRELATWHQEGQFSMEQQRHYDKVLELLAGHQPLLDRMFADEPTSRRNQG